MRKFLLIVLALLTGCATGNVVPAGKDSYSLSASRCGFCEPVQGYVTEQASAYCEAKGKHLSIRYIQGNNMQPMFPGSATIYFSCYAEDDPRYQEADMRRDNGVTTIQNR